MVTKLPFASWLAEQGWTYEAFGALVNRSRQTISRWALGQRRPAEEDMRIVFLATDGRVTPDDWYPLAQWRAQLGVQRAAQHGPTGTGAAPSVSTETGSGPQGEGAAAAAPACGAA